MKRGVGLPVVILGVFVVLVLLGYALGILKIWGGVGGGNSTILSRDGGTMTRYSFGQAYYSLGLPVFGPLFYSRMYMALVMDGGENSGVLEGGEKHRQAFARGNLRTDDGRDIAWSSSSPDGRRGNVIIDGQKFDLKHGALFLVSTKNKRTRVEQLTVDIQPLSPTLDDQKLVRLGTAHPRIAAFLRSLPTEKAWR